MTGFRSMRRIAEAGLAVFLAAVVAEHVARPGLDPLRHQVSEYANGEHGWLMTLGFAAWALSLLATAASLREDRPVVRGLLVAAGAGLVVTAIWRTQTSAGALPLGVERTASGRLHDLGSGVTSVMLLLAAVSVACAGWAPPGLRRLSAGVVMVAVVASAALLAIGADVGGLRQRVLLACACAWQVALLALARRGHSDEVGRRHQRVAKSSSSSTSCGQSERRLR